MTEVPINEDKNQPTANPESPAPGSSDHLNGQDTRSCEPDRSPGDESQTPPAGGEEDNLRKELEEARAEAAGNYDRYVRLAAEMENFRRRTDKEKSDLQKFSTETFCKALLPVLDSFDRATAGLSEQKDQEGTASLAEGILMVKKQLMETLEKQGLTAIEAVGSPFDPNLHQAIRKVEDAEAKEELVKEEYSRGYLLNDRLIRPAMVSVAVPQEG